MESNTSKKRILRRFELVVKDQVYLFNKLKIKYLSIFIAVLFMGNCSSIAQDIHPLEPIKNHYKSLQSISAEPNAERSHLDKIDYPSDRYNSGSLIYIMVPPIYLNPGQIEKLKSLVKPPANSSDQTKAELEFLLAWQKKRTKSQEERAGEVLAPIGYWPHIGLLKSHSRYKSNLEHLFFEGRTVLGESCKPENYPATAKLLEGVTRDMRIMEFTVKYHLLRPRPYQLNDKLKPMAQMSTPSFASGHTLWAYIQAFVWSELVPTKRSEFLDLAYEVGESREIMGIHYPSDEEAARILAHQMLTEMLANSVFRADLENAKLEWK
ncbi:MAG: phosphatase PAP2 family protein [Reichenbachiella sp.]|uniref:phosphatase PAP2 family protein n=3 Tax=Reichenbachiella sp. TaxID=2184521 RepID=UPI003266FEFC